MHRRLLRHEIWHDIPACRMFMLLIASAAFKEITTLNGIKLGRGQVLISYRRLRQELSYRKQRGYGFYSLRTINRAIDVLKRNGMITISETECGTLSTVTNYEKYQSISVDAKQSETQFETKEAWNGIRKRNNKKEVKEKELHSVDVSGRPLQEID